MPVLKNARWELFAQGLAQGKTEDAAYEAAGFRSHRGNASRLSANASVQRRKAEIMAPAARHIEVTVERLAKRLGNISLARVVDYVEVRDGKVYIGDTKGLPDEVADAIAQLKPTKDGVEVKFHDPLMAINLLGKHKGMFKENINLMADQTLADLVMASLAVEKPKGEG